MTLDDEDSKTAACCGTFCCVLIISCILFGVSFDVIDPIQMGLAYDGNVQNVEFEKTYGSGRYLIGLGRSFIKFPATYQTIRLGEAITLHHDEPNAPQIECRSYDGLRIDLEVTVQYLLSRDPGQLYSLYMDTGEEYEKLYMSMIQQVVRDIASRYYAADFRQGRDAIAEKIHIALDEAFRKMFATVPSFELVNMEINPQLATAIETTRVMEQDIEQAKNEKLVEEIKAQKLVEVTNVTATKFVLVAENQAKEILKIANGNAQILKQKIHRQILAYKQLQLKLGLDNEELLSYLWIEAMQNSGAKDVLMSQDFPKAYNM